ncbi:MAG: acyltransferase family protein [Candidatus Microthrix parvicella]
MTERSAWHDNVRVVGICLVVAGHWGLARGFYPGVSDPSGDMIFLFHMPLFVMLSGRFVKPAAAPMLTFRKSWGSLILPLVMFAAFNLSVLALVADRPRVTLGYVPFGLWFLVSLFFWRLLATVVGRRRVVDWLLWPLALLGVAVSGLIPNHYSIMRTLAFFPVFLFGMQILPQIETWLRRPWVRVSSGAVVAVAGSVVWANAARIQNVWFQHRLTYAELGGSATRSAGIRILVLVIGVVVSCAVMSLVPERRAGRLSELGRYTLYAYLIHLPVTLVLNFWLSPRIEDRPAARLALLLAMVPFTLLAMSRPVRRLTEPMVEPVKFATSGHPTSA